MRKWMMKFEVTGDLGVQGEIGALAFKHPDDRYEVHLENYQMKPGTEHPLLHAYVLFDEEDLARATDAGPRHLRAFIPFLSLSTGSRFHRTRPVCLFDWSADAKEMREGIMFKQHPSPDIPQLAMGSHLVDTVQTLLNSDGDEDLMESLRWFSEAVAASAADDQFQLFWLTIETLAQDTTEVPDRCARCREPLHCPKCNTISMHRPYPAQRIQALFARHIQGGTAEKFFEIASKMRNALAHGNPMSDVEKSVGTTLNDVVDDLARVAWVALLDRLLKASRLKGQVQLRPIQPQTFLHFGVSMNVHLAMGFAMGRVPTFADIPTGFNIDLIINEHPHVQPDEPLSTPSPYLIQGSQNPPDDGKPK